MKARIAFPSSRLLATALLIGVGAPPTWAQSPAARGVIDGVVTDTNLVSLGDATASILGSTIQVVTGANGRFRIHGLQTGQYILVVRRLGYAPTSTALQVAGGDTLRMAFALERIATALDTVTVTAKRYSMRMAEFEYQRKLGFGHFMTQAEIEKRNSVYVSDLVRTMMSVNVVPSPGGGGHVATSIRGRCVLRLILDGVALSTFNLDDLPSPKQIAGIEVYTGPAQIPIQYRDRCGIIRIWTRDGF